jgi:O-antigen/teichoic acid export membrane protein
MSRDAYGAWALVLQLGAYVGYLDFGVQTAVARFVAHAKELGDSDYRDRIVATALATLASSGFLAWIGIVVITAFLPRMFHQLPSTLLHDVRTALILVAGSLAIGLPASVFNGIFGGLQRNEIPAAIIGSSRLATAILIVWIARHGGSLTLMGLAVASVNIASYLLQYFICRRAVPDLNFSPRFISKPAALELFNYCISLTIWGLGLLMVTGLDLTIVGMYRFSEVAYYSVAAMAITFFGGAYSAIFSSIFPAAAVLHARKDELGLGRMVVVTSRYGMLLLLITGLPLIFSASLLLRLWVGQTYAAHAALVLQILVVANIIRMCVTPYIMAILGSGQQRLIVLTPLLEGVTNIVFSLVGGYFLGAIGVALGTLLGAIVGLAGGLFYNVRRTVGIKFGLAEYIQDSLLRPCWCAVPVIVVAFLLHALPQSQPQLKVALGVLGTSLSLWCFWVFGLMPNERHKLKARAQAFLLRFQTQGSAN